MTIIRPVLRYLDSPDVPNLETFRSDDDSQVGFLIQAAFGPAHADGEELFDIFVCTPKWLAARVEDVGIMPGRHYLFVKRFDFGSIRDFLIKFADTCVASSWEDVAMKLSRIGRWEFEDYVPYRSNE